MFDHSCNFRIPKEGHDPEEIEAQARKASQEKERLEMLLGNEDFDSEGAQRFFELIASILARMLLMRLL